jgi:hypothetical protein
MPQDSKGSSLPFVSSKPVEEMSMVEISDQLEKVTAWIGEERSREREARGVYDVIAGEVEANVKSIRQYAVRLLHLQRQKLSSFDGMLGKAAPRPTVTVKATGLARQATFKKAGGAEPKNLAEAIVSIWTLERYAEPLTTEEIAEALPEVGHQTEAAATSLRSSINQALAKLCRVGRVVRFRADGSQIDPKDNASRARKYLGAIRLPEPV